MDFVHECKDLWWKSVHVVRAIRTIEYGRGQDCDNVTRRRRVISPLLIVYGNPAGDARRRRRLNRGARADTRERVPSDAGGHRVFRGPVGPLFEYFYGATFTTVFSFLPENLRTRVRLGLRFSRRRPLLRRCRTVSDRSIFLYRDYSSVARFTGQRCVAFFPEGDHTRQYYPFFFFFSREKNSYNRTPPRTLVK